MKLILLFLAIAATSQIQLQKLGTCVTSERVCPSDAITTEEGKCVWERDDEVKPEELPVSTSLLEKIMEGK